MLQGKVPAAPCANRDTPHGSQASLAMHHPAVPDSKPHACRLRHAAAAACVAGGAVAGGRGPGGRPCGGGRHQPSSAARVWRHRHGRGDGEPGATFRMQKARDSGDLAAQKLYISVDISKTNTQKYTPMLRPDIWYLWSGPVTVSGIWSCSKHMNDE